MSEPMQLSERLREDAVWADSKGGRWCELGDRLRERADRAAELEAALELATEEMVAEDKSLFRVPRDSGWWLMLARSNADIEAHKPPDPPDEPLRRPIEQEHYTPVGLWDTQPKPTGDWSQQ